MHLIFKTECDTWTGIMSDFWRCARTRSMHNSEIWCVIATKTPDCLYLDLLPLITWILAEVDLRQTMGAVTLSALTHSTEYLRPGEGRACYQSKETSQSPSQLILIFLGTNQQVLVESPSLLPSIDTLVSTALLSASHYLASCEHAEAKIVSGNSLVKTKRLFPHKLLLFAGISFGPANVKHVESITIPEKCRLLPLQTIHQPRRYILLNNPEVPIWSKHIPG